MPFPDHCYLLGNYLYTQYNLQAMTDVSQWQSSYTPRRIKHSTYANKGPPNPNSSCALLLVNHEARSCFLEQYTLWTHDRMLWIKDKDKRQRTYINFDIDTLCISSMNDLSYLLELYPNIMQQVQWVDMMPTKWPRHLKWQNNGGYVLKSLQLITITNLQSEQDGENVWFHAEHIINTVNNLGLDFGEQYRDTGTCAVIAALFRPWEQDRTDVACEASDCGLFMKDPSPATWARFEVEMSHAFWPGRDFEKSVEEGWITAEFDIIKDWDSGLPSDGVVV
jgi:hypothetical protein